MLSVRRKLAEQILARLRNQFPDAFVTFAIPSVAAGMFQHELGLMLTWSQQQRRDVLSNRADKVVTFEVHCWKQWDPQDAQSPVGLDLLDLGDELERVLMIDPRWTGLAHDTRVGQQILEPFAEDGIGVVALRLPFEVQFFHDLQDPTTYTQAPIADGGFGG